MSWFDDSKYTKYRVIRLIRLHRTALSAYSSVIKGGKIKPEYEMVEVITSYASGEHEPTYSIDGGKTWLTKSQTEDLKGIGGQ